MRALFSKIRFSRSAGPVASRRNAAFFFILFCFLAPAICPLKAFAACANPAGIAGQMVYNTTHRVYQYCNGTSWIAMGKFPGSGGGGCSNPAGVEGKLMYNGTSYVMQYCDGSVWRAMGPTGSGGGSCTFSNIEQKLLASDGATSDQFGGAVAVDGDTAVFGASQDAIGATTQQGSAYVFTRDSSSTWNLQQKLTASDGAQADFFGTSVAVSGDTVLIGANGKDNGANTDQGSAYVFTRSGTTWTQQQKLTASDGAWNDQLGWSVALEGDTAVIGAPVVTVGGNVGQGAAYVFTRSGTTWSEQQKLTASDGAAMDDFGAQGGVALSGDTALIAADSDDANTGSAYVFTRSGSTWSQQQKLTASDAATSDFFGHSVDLSGDTALIGAYGNGDSGYESGSAYVFTRSGSTWSQQQKLLASDGAANDHFGHDVALSGAMALIGAHAKTVGSNAAQGAAYVFTRSGSTWSQQQTLTAFDGAAGDAFGGSVDVSGSTALSGASGDDDLGGSSGSAYFLGCGPANVIALGTGQTKTTNNTTITGLSGRLSAGASLIFTGASDTALTGVFLNNSSATTIGTFTKDAEAANTGNVITSIWSLHNLTSSQAANGDNVYFMSGAADAKAGAVSMVSGLASSPFDKSATGTGSSSTAPATSGTSTTAQADEILIGAVGTEGDRTDNPGIWAAGFTAGQRWGTTGSGGASNVTISEGYRLVSSTGAFQTAKTGITSADYGAAIATYKALAPTGAGGCTSPSGVEGRFLYNGTSNVMQYCNGANWVRTGK